MIFYVMQNGLIEYNLGLDFIKGTNEQMFEIVIQIIFGVIFLQALWMGFMLQFTTGKKAGNNNLLD